MDIFGDKPLPVPVSPISKTEESEWQMVSIRSIIEGIAELR